jgi:hypothetical protein
MVTQARNDKDATRLNCLNDKLMSMKGLVRMSADAYLDLAQTDAKSEKARYQLGIIRGGHRRMTELETAASACTGKAGSYTGSTELNVLIDNNLTGIANEFDYYDTGGSQFHSPNNQIADGPDDAVGEDDPADGRPPTGSSFQ